MVGTFGWAYIANNQRADGRHLRLLRARRERPRGHTAERG